MRSTNAVFGGLWGQNGGTTGGGFKTPLVLKTAQTSHRMPHTHTHAHTHAITHTYARTAEFALVASRPLLIATHPQPSFVGTS